MAKLSENPKNKISLRLTLPRYVGYCDCAFGTKIFFRLENASSKTVRLKIKSRESELFLPFEAEAEVPFGGAVSLCAENILSARFLEKNLESRGFSFYAEVFCEEELVASATAETTALPFGYFEGLTGMAEKIAYFVQPRCFQAARIVREAKRRLLKRGMDFYGYENADRAAVKAAASEIFSIIKEYGFTRTQDFDLSRPAPALLPSAASLRKTDAFRLALFAAACFQRAGLNAVLALGKNAAGAGVRLCDGEYETRVFDDAKEIKRRLCGKESRLVFFDAEDLFARGEASFSASCENFLRKLGAGGYECFVDVSSCQAQGFAPPSAQGAEDAEELCFTQKAVKNFAAPAPQRNAFWERELSDFSSRNPLLGFKGKNALKLMTDDADGLIKKLAQSEGMLITGSGESAEAADKNVLRTPLSVRETEKIALNLKRKNREAFEETGAKILFLACGFLEYGEGDGETKCAPVVLLPVEISRAKRESGFTLSAFGEKFVNATLFEYLKGQHGIDVLAAEAASSVEEALIAVQRAVCGRAGWRVNRNVYVAPFFFQRFLMWNDIKTHFGEFEKNRNVRALLSGKGEAIPYSPSAGAEDLLLPLASDASQREAVRLSEEGVSFVLHGPPGTGKSQTIANIISRALERGKTVLVVAEKKAAIDVVKRRLDEIGIGDFCLELNAKTNCNEVFEQFRRTLSLKEQKNEREEFFSSQEYVAARRELSAAQRALHEKRKLSLSVHEAILGFLERKDERSSLKIGGDFYASLDDKQLADCRKAILRAAAAAKACGGVFNTPFENVNLKEYTPKARDGAIFAGRALLGEIAHFKCFLALTLDFFKQKISSFTEEKARELSSLLGGLLSKKYAPYFTGVGLEEFFAFRSANLRLDTCLSFYEKHFKLLVNLQSDLEELQRFTHTGGDYRLFRAAASLKKRLERIALHPLAEADIPKYIGAAVGIFEARKQIAQSPLSKSFLDKSGRISEKRRSEYLAPLKELTSLGAAIFSEFSPERFFEGCIRAANGCADPLFNGYLAAAEGFFRAEENYLECTKAERERIGGEDVLEYFSAKAAALLENADLLGWRCDYKAAEEELKKRGMKFIGDALESGSLSPEGALNGFEKSLYEYFLSVNISSDFLLSRMTTEGEESAKEKFAMLFGRQTEYARRQIKSALISRLPQDGESREELALLYRLERGVRRGRLRALFHGAPALVKRVCPCLLASPDAAAQYLVPRADEYDLVIFDEASQMTVGEAIPSLARAKQAIVVGDNRQLPPASFFRTAFPEEYEEEAPPESVLDAAIGAGFEERSLLWHYRSKHESLVAFSNAMYYENRLYTFPSPLASESRVTLKRVAGVYDRGGAKHNRKEAEAVVAEIVARLVDPKRRSQSIGVVTFSNAQREEIEKILSREIKKRDLEELAYGGREPLFVKNLENVQGDERDVIFFSVCYGFDKENKLSYCFGALNRAGGWRRLNVACSRAREEMTVFSSLTAEDIDLNRTASKGVAGLKALLEFAQKGRSALALPPEEGRGGLGKYLAEELLSCGYECRVNVGTGKFKIDVAVLDPRDKSRFLLGILTDASAEDSAVDRALLPAMLKKSGWNLTNVSEVSYFNNPKREIKRIKDLLDNLSGTREEHIYAKPYRFFKDSGGKTAAFITDARNDGEIKKRLEEIVKREEPISRAFLKRRCLESFGVVARGARVNARLDEIISRAAFRFETAGGTEYFYKNASALSPKKFRREGGKGRRKTEEDFTPFETAVLIKGILEEQVTLYDDEIASLVAAEYGVKETAGFSAFVARTLAYGEGKGMFIRSLSGRISLA